MIEDGFINVDLAVDQPVRTLHQVSHDPALRHLVTLRSGRTLTAVQLQMEYFELARKYVEERFGADADEQTKDVLGRWEDVLNRLENDPMSLSGELDWIAKRELMEGYRRRDGLGLGRGPAAPRGPPVRRRTAREGPLQPAGGPRQDEAAPGRARRSCGPRPSLRRTPGRTSAAAAWSSTRTTSRRPPGTRSSSTCRAVTRSSGYQPWNPYAERVTT